MVVLRGGVAFVGVGRKSVTAQMQILLMVRLCGKASGDSLMMVLEMLMGVAGCDVAP